MDSTIEGFQDRKYNIENEHHKEDCLQQENGHYEEDCLQPGNGHYIEDGHVPRRSSLVSFAKFESFKNKVAEELRITELQKTEVRNLDLTREEIILLSQFPKEDVNIRVETNLVFSMNDLFSLTFILRCIEKQIYYVKHLETRPSRKARYSFDVLVQLALKKSELLNIIELIRQIDNVALHGIPKNGSSFKDIWYPKHISDLDKCIHVLSKFEPDLDSSHPGFSDVVYRARRKEIAEIAFKYKYGRAISPVNYTKDEIKTWGIVFKKMHRIHSKYACASYRKAFRLLEEECNFKPDAIPQMQDVSMFLKKNTGFTLRPASGLVTARDFLASLAFRVFQCTQYVRHSCNPDHSPEPDCIHELLGHVPMLADPEFAKFSQEIGLASLGSSDADIEKLSTIYWFTVEFGLCKEDNTVKAYGAGLLSSYGELQHALSERPKLQPFDPEITALQPYQDLTYQDLYFVAESFNDAKEKIRNFVDTHFNRQKKIVYDAYTESVVEMDTQQLLKNTVDSMASELSTLTKAIHRLKPSEF